MRKSTLFWEWLLYKHIAHKLSTEWPFYCYFRELEADCCMCMHRSKISASGKFPGSHCVGSQPPVGLYASSLVFLAGSPALTKQFSHKCDFCPPNDILQCLKTLLCYWHGGMLLDVLQWCASLYQKKNYLAENVNSAQFEKLYPKQIFDPCCLFLPVIKVLITSRVEWSPKWGKPKRPPQPEPHPFLALGKSVPFSRTLLTDW